MPDDRLGRFVPAIHVTDDQYIRDRHKFTELQERAKSFLLRKFDDVAGRDESGQTGAGRFNYFALAESRASEARHSKWGPSTFCHSRESGNPEPRHVRAKSGCPFRPA